MFQITYANEQPQPDFRRVLWGTKYYAVPYNFPWYTAYTEVTVNWFVYDLADQLRFIKCLIKICI